MTIELTQILQKATANDEEATQTLFTFFKEQKLSREEQESVHLYLKTVSQKNHHAIYLRALLYEYGYGVKQDVVMSFLLLREAAASGNPKATYEVGRHFLEGIGVNKNYESAFQWLELAADSPHYTPGAMYDLGRMYEQGLGIEPDSEKAKAWFEKAAQRGYQAAKEKLRA